MRRYFYTRDVFDEGMVTGCVSVAAAYSHMIH
jgi:hypothetical protein